MTTDRDMINDINIFDYHDDIELTSYERFCFYLYKDCVESGGMLSNQQRGTLIKIWRKRGTAAA